MLRKALPIIPLCKRGAGTQLQRSAVDCREREREGRERKQERGKRASGGEMTEVFMSAGLGEYS